MAQTKAGAEKLAAARLGMSIIDYTARRDAGEKHCTRCKTWKRVADYNRDRSRGDGLSACCIACQAARGKASYTPVAPEHRKPKGPPPLAQRNGDKAQARGRVSTMVRNGSLPNPNTLACTDCGHLADDRRHEYHHYKGYQTGNHEYVIPLCTICHVARDSLKVDQTHCIHGHEFNAANTAIKSNGCRACRTCQKLWEASRGPRGSKFWQKVNSKRARRPAAQNG